MKKLIMIASITLLSCHGAESSKATAALAPPLKSAIKTGPSTKGRIRFYQNRLSLHKDIQPEVSTMEQKHNARIKAQEKYQKRARQTQSQSSRFQATEKANREWQTNGAFRPTHTLYDPSLALVNARERAEKLETLSNVLKFEQETAYLTDQEQLSQQRAYESGQRVAPFLKLATMDLETLETLLERWLIYLQQNYARELQLLTSFIVTTLIDEGLIEDKTLKEKGFATQFKEIERQGALYPETFQQFLHEYLEASGYSFPHPASVFPAAAAVVQSEPAELLRRDPMIGGDTEFEDDAIPLAWKLSDVAPSDSPEPIDFPLSSDLPEPIDLPASADYDMSDEEYLNQLLQ